MFWIFLFREKAGVAYEALDNGFLSCADPAFPQKRCDQLGTGAVRDFFWRWYWRLPSPFTKKDLDAGYVYELAFRQFEVSDTVIFDRSQAGRAWFEGVIRDHLDIGRPDQVALIFQRRIDRRTPGPFRTRVITKGVEPILTCWLWVGAEPDLIRKGTEARGQRCLRKPFAPRLAIGRGAELSREVHAPNLRRDTGRRRQAHVWPDGRVVVEAAGACDLRKRESQGIHPDGGRRLVEDTRHEE